MDIEGVKGRSEMGKEHMVIHKSKTETSIIKIVALLLRKPVFY